MTLSTILVVAIHLIQIASVSSGDMARLGSVKVGEHRGQVLFQFPDDDGVHYRVDVAISKPNGIAVIESERIDVWLLARDGRSVAIQGRPRPGALIEVNSAGTTADAIYLFANDVERRELVGVVVNVDGELNVFKIPPPK